MRFFIIFWITNISALAGHPRLFFSADEIPVLREKVRHEPFASMLKEIRRMAEEKSSGDSMYAFEVRTQQVTRWTTVTRCDPKGAYLLLDR